MKRFLSLFLGLSLLVGSAGCVTTGVSGQPPKIEVTESRLRQITVVAELAAYNGTAIYLKDHSDKKYIFETVAFNLGVLGDENRPTVEKFVAIVRNLPIKELQSDEGKIIVESAIILINAFNDDLVNLEEIEQVKNLRPIILAVKRGIDRGLGKEVE